jgi:CubicO group peptidase (beta-lactamase class C family)
VDTRYDLASLTKVVATLPAIVRLLSDREVALDDRVGRFFSNAGWFQNPTLADVTIRQLLSHTSGLTNWRAIFAWVSTRKTFFANVLQSEVGPAGPLVYSDLGFIVLGAIVERVAKLRQDVFCQRNLYEPLGMSETGYGPITDTLVAATEDCGWRNEVLEGVVHDENAYCADGVAGHAGLFSTVDDLATYAQAWLRLDARLGREEVLRETMKPAAGGGSKTRRGLGWMLSSDDFFSGSRATAAGFGHTGFTGTSLWIEPDDDWFAILLSNRVHPSRECGKKMHQLRQIFHYAACKQVTMQRESQGS